MKGLSDSWLTANHSETKRKAIPLTGNANTKHVILLGAPGAGKGTQATVLSELLGLPHVSSGDLFRDNLKRETPLGLQAKAYMDKGELVPDDVTVAMVRDRLSQLDCDSKGAILDGFPRTVEQAKSLDKVLHQDGKKVDVVIYIEVPEDVLVERLTGRWICRNCQAVYHTLFNPPKVAGKCDVCGGELYQRPDDRPETVRNRLDVYFEQTLPLVDFYREQGLLHEIDGQQEIAAVKSDLLKVIQSE
jgi:adenylate kinase